MKTPLRSSLPRPSLPPVSLARRAARPALACVLVLAAALFASPAFAAGSVKLQSTNLPESGGAWHLFATLELPSAPPTAHQTLRFVFTKTSAYELDLVDGKDKPVENKINLGTQLPTIETQDVDFSDGTGKIYKKTRFDFNVTRAHSYGPGEYTLEVKTSDNVELGKPQTLVLSRSTDPNDPNIRPDIVDRRSMSFEKKDTKVSNVVGDGGLGGTQGESAVPQNGDIAASGSATPFIPDSAYQPTPEEQGLDHPKGCGCAVPGTGSAPGQSLAGLGTVGLAVVLAWRRRRAKDHGARS